jgi:hypothetical protein
MGDDLILAVLKRLEAGQDKFRAELLAQLDRFRAVLTEHHEADAANSDAAERAEVVALAALAEVRGMAALVQQLQAEILELRGNLRTVSS